MLHRVFLAINLPESIKNKLVEYQENITRDFSGRCPVRWTKKENLHITLVFLGSVSNDGLLEVLRIAKEVTERNSAFSITLNRVCYGPPKQMPPRMVWVDGKKSQEFATLKDDLEKTLAGEKRINFSTDARAFSPHITLGRIKAWAFRQIEPEERPEIEEEISLGFSVKSIEVMESELKRWGPEYTILESFLFKE